MDHLSLIHSAFEEIKHAKGNAKLPIIKRVCEHPIIKQAMIALLDPAVVFHVGKKSLLTLELRIFPF